MIKKKIKYQQPLLHSFGNGQIQNSLAYCSIGSGATRNPATAVNCTNGPLPQGAIYCMNGTGDNEALYQCKTGTGVIKVNSCGAGTSPQLP